MSGAAADSSIDDVDPIAMVAAWRAGRESRPDPVTLAVVEGLARRAAVQQGPARRWMMHRIEAMLATQQMIASGEVAPSTARPTTTPTMAERAGLGHRTALAALGDLVDQLGRTPVSSSATAPSSQAVRAPAKNRPKGALPAAASAAATPRPLKAVTAFKGTWSRLRADQRLRQVLAQVPPMAGPLNSAHVVNRALQTMRELSPEYLDAFILHIDALLWLEQSSGGDLLPRAAAAGDERHRSAERRPRKA